MAESQNPSLINIGAMLVYVMSNPELSLTPVSVYSYIHKMTHLRDTHSYQKPTRDCCNVFPSQHTVHQVDLQWEMQFHWDI